MGFDTIQFNILAADDKQAKLYFKETFNRFLSEPVLKLLFQYEYYKYKLDDDDFIYRVVITLTLPKVWVFFLFLSGLFFVLNFAFPAWILLAFGLGQAVFYVPKLWVYATVKGLKRKGLTVRALSDKDALNIIFNEIS